MDKNDGRAGGCHVPPWLYTRNGLVYFCLPHRSVDGLECSKTTQFYSKLWYKYSCYASASQHFLHIKTSAVMAPVLTCMPGQKLRELGLLWLLGFFFWVSVSFGHMFSFFRLIILQNAYAAPSPAKG